MESWTAASSLHRPAPAPAPKVTIVSWLSAAKHCLLTTTTVALLDWVLHPRKLRLELYFYILPSSCATVPDHSSLTSRSQSTFPFGSWPSCSQVLVLGATVADLVTSS